MHKISRIESPFLSALIRKVGKRVCYADDITPFNEQNLRGMFMRVRMLSK